MEVVGALDQGTTSTRFILYDRAGDVVCSHQVQFPQHQPKAGWFEHDPEEIWDSVETCMAQCMAKARAAHPAGVSVVAVGITNQRETTLAWDWGTGQPLHNAIVWMDTRTSAICHRVQQEHGGPDCFRDVTGLPVSTYFSGYKMRWLLDHSPAVQAAAAAGTCRLATIDSWLIYRLTGGAPGGGRFVTDVSNASRTGLMDLVAREWHQGACEALGVDRKLLPTIVSNSEVYGHVASGPLQGVPVSGCLGDQQAALLGQRCAPGQAKNTYGTGCFLLLNTGHQPVPSKHGLLTTMGFQLGAEGRPHYALEGSVAFAGGGISWLQDQLGIISSPEESEEVAGSVTDTAGCYFVPAFGGLLAPHWRDDARGTIVGLTAYTGRAHVVRALLEAIAFQSREVLDAMRKDADLSDLHVLRVDGGASTNDLLLQLQADLLQVPVERPAHLETTSLGAALAAGLAVGFYNDKDIFQGQHQERYKVFEPSVPRAEADRRFGCWKRAVERSLDLADFIENGSSVANGAS